MHIEHANLHRNQVACFAYLVVINSQHFGKQQLFVLSSGSNVQHTQPSNTCHQPTSHNHFISAYLPHSISIFSRLPLALTHSYFVVCIYSHVHNVANLFPCFNLRMICLCMYARSDCGFYQNLECFIFCGFFLLLGGKSSWLKYDSGIDNAIIEGAVRFYNNERKTTNWHIPSFTYTCFVVCFILFRIQWRH